MKVCCLYEWGEGAEDLGVDIIAVQSWVIKKGLV